MPNPAPGFEQILAQLKQNISKNTLDRQAAITQIRTIRDAVGFDIVHELVTFAGSYGLYPPWNTSDLQGWWTLAPTDTGATHSHAHVGGDGAINGNPVAASAFDPNAFVNPTGRMRFYTSFDGSGDYLNSGDITALDGEDSFTLGFRVRDTDSSIGLAQAITGRWPTNHINKQFLVRIDNSGKISYYESVDDVGGQARVSAEDTILSLDTWYSVIITKSGATINIYINNNTAQSTSGSGTPIAALRTVAGDVLIARQESQTSVDLVGDLQDVSWWDVVLSSSEIQEFMDVDISDVHVANLTDVD